MTEKEDTGEGRGSDCESDRDAGTTATEWGSTLLRGGVKRGRDPPLLRPVRALGRLRLPSIALDRKQGRLA